MNGADIFVALILTVILGGAIFYIVKAKKSGQKCVGCPHSKTCGKSGSCRCGK